MSFVHTEMKCEWMKRIKFWMEFSFSDKWNSYGLIKWGHDSSKNIWFNNKIKCVHIAHRFIVACAFQTSAKFIICPSNTEVLLVLISIYYIRFASSIVRYLVFQMIEQVVGWWQKRKLFPCIILAENEMEWIENE